MSMIGNQPGVSSQRTVLEEVVTGSPKSAFVPQGGYIKGYVDVLVNGTELDASDFTAADGITITLAVAAAVGDTVKVKAWLPRGLSDGYLKSEADDRFAALVSGNIIVPANSGGSRVIGAASNSNTTVVLQAGAASGSGANIELTKEGTIFNDASTHKFRSLDGGTEYATINGNGLVLPAGKGIDFSANGNASGMTSEVLDDYETGTWTPIMITDGGGHSVTHTVQRGVYTKVGRVVTVSWYVAWSAFTGGSNGVRISNLPFLSQNSGPGVYYTGANAEHSSSISYPPGMTTLTYEMAQNATTLLPVLNGSGGGTVGLTKAYVGTGSGYLIGSVTYDAA